MKLICPKCNSNIDQSNINIKKGIGLCQSCSEVIKLADHLHSNEEIRRSEKPFYSKISTLKEAGNFIIKIPPKGLSLKTALTPLCFILIVLIFHIFTSNQNEGLQSLTHIRLQNCSMIRLIELPILAKVTARNSTLGSLAKLPALTHLSMCGCVFFEEDIKQYTKLKCLTNISLYSRGREFPNLRKVIGGTMNGIRLKISMFDTQCNDIHADTLPYEIIYL